MTQLANHSTPDESKILHFPSPDSPPRNKIAFSEWPEIMDHNDIMYYVGLSHAQAWEALKSNAMYRPFPNDKRGMVTGKYAIRDFLNGRIISEVS